MRISERHFPSSQRTLGSCRGIPAAPGDASLRWHDGWGFVPLLLLAACGHQQPGNTTAPDPALVNAEAAANAQAADDGRILCATGGAAALTRTCTVDRETSPRGLVLTLHHADGGFHRLLVTTDGRGVIAADGAQGATVTIVDPDEIEVKLGGDRYRLPATVGKSKA